MVDKNFLGDIYSAKSVADTRTIYDDWSLTYDHEVAQNGYVTPTRIAAALAGLIPNKASAILDFGCGTGISGVALKAAGFSVIDGCDLSHGMFAQAREKSVYRRLWLSDPDGALAISAGDYAAITAVGVVSIGAAPPETMDMLIAALAPGGLLAFSFNDHTLQDPRFEARVNQHLDNGHCTLILRQDGEHLPGIGLRATVFVLHRL